MILQRSAVHCLCTQFGFGLPICKQFMAREQDEDLVRVLDRKNPPSMLGSEKFISRIKDPLLNEI